VIVVSDTSPLINLAIIGKLEILPELFGQVIIPEKVFDEVVIQGADMPGAEEVRKVAWIVVMVCSNRSLVQSLQQQIDPGEAEAIALSLEIRADLLLIDERLGRALAKDFHLPIMGLLGVLKIAKNKGLIAKIKPVLDELIHKAGFRIATELYRQILESEGEI
jgi:predicted nucleic acid-binding protein